MKTEVSRVSKKAKYRAILFMFSSLLIAAVLLFIYCASVFVYMRFPIGKISGTYTVYIGDAAVKPERREYRKNMPASKLFRNGVTYVNFTQIARQCGFSVTGDTNSLRYLIGSDREDKEQFTLSAGNAYVEIGSTSVALEGKAIYTSGELWLPISFVNRYIDGISIYVDHSKKRLVVDCEGNYLLTLHGDAENPVISKNHIP